MALFDRWLQDFSTLRRPRITQQKAKMKANDTAYPSTKWTVDKDGCQIGTPTEGLRVIDHVAIEAMRGIISNQAMIDGLQDSSIKWVVEHSYALAKAMLAESEKH